MAGKKVKLTDDHKEGERKKKLTASSSPSSSSSSYDERDYQIEDVKDPIKSSRGSRFNLLENEFGWVGSTRRKLSRQSLIDGIKELSRGSVIHPDNRWYRLWNKFILIWAIYSSFFTPLEFGFMRGLPKKLFILDVAGQVAFLVDIVLQFFVAYRDRQTYRMVYKRTPIALRYLKSSFTVDLLACLPWDLIYKASGRKEEVRYLLWIRLCRVRKCTDFFQKLEKDIRINYMFTRIAKLLAVELYCSHTAASIFYYLATTLPASQEEYTWIGSLKLGSYTYSNFREMDLWKRYITSLYFAIVTMATVGYGDIHAVNVREMIFIMIYVSFDMVLGAYLIGNMTALIVKGSNTEKFRDKMTDVMKYMNRNRLGRDIRDQIRGHLRLQYERSYTSAAVLQDFPISIRAKISQRLYFPYIEKVYLFKDCSTEFINQIVMRVQEEFFLPGEVIMEQGNVVDQVYFICNGVLEIIVTGEDGSDSTVTILEPESVFGEISILCNIPQPYTVRVCELCRLLRLDKESFTNVLDIYFYDGRKILNNLLKERESNHRVKLMETDITFHIGKQEAELALKVISAAYYGELYKLKGLIRAGADANKTDYDGRSPLHLAASKGHEDIVLFLIQEKVEINIKDNFGNTPLLEAVKNGHDRIASLLVKEGAVLDVDNAGSFLCAVVARGDSDYLKRILSYGIDPNTKDYDYRTPLHIAASEGLHFMAKLLLEAGASVLVKDRWGSTPMDDARLCGNHNLIKMLEGAKCVQLSEAKQMTEISTDVVTFEVPFKDKTRLRKCTVFPIHPWDPPERRRAGIVLFVPHTMEELVQKAAEQLGHIRGSCILSQDGGKILDIDMIEDDQKLYLVDET